MCLICTCTCTRVLTNDINKLTNNANQVHHILRLFLLVPICIEWVIECAHVQKMYIVLQIICTTDNSFGTPTQYNTKKIVEYIDVVIEQLQRYCVQHSRPFFELLFSISQ